VPISPASHSRQGWQLGIISQTPHGSWINNSGLSSGRRRFGSEDRHPDCCAGHGKSTTVKTILPQDTKFENSIKPCQQASVNTCAAGGAPAHRKKTAAGIPSHYQEGVAGGIRLVGRALKPAGGGAISALP
jgi:hypothetical protein